MVQKYTPGEIPRLFYLFISRLVTPKEVREFLADKGSPTILGVLHRFDVTKLVDLHVFEALDDPGTL
jgi:hypothetical protein